MKKTENIQSLKSFLWLLLAFSVVLAIFAWGQTLPWVYNNFKRICDANGGAACMKVYWNQKDYYIKVLTDSLIVTGVAALANVLVILGTVKKKRTKK